MRLAVLAGVVDADDATLAGRAGAHDAPAGREDRMVAADPGPVAWTEAGAALADDDLAAADLLAGEHLDPEHLRVRISPVAARAKSLLVRHQEPSFFAAGLRAAGFLAAGFFAAGFFAAAFLAAGFLAAGFLGARGFAGAFVSVSALASVAGFASAFGSSAFLAAGFLVSRWTLEPSSFASPERCRAGGR